MQKEECKIPFGAWPSLKVVNPFLVRFKSVAKPFHRIDEKLELQGNYIGITD